MKKTKALKWMNLLLALVFLSQAASAFLRTVIPYEIFRVLHGYGGYVLLMLVLLHVALNWRWVTSQFRKK